MANIHNGYQGVFDNHIRCGKKAALVIVDFIEAYADPASPFYSREVVEASRALLPLLNCARSVGLPIVWTRVEYAHPEAADGGVFVEKVPALKNLRRGAFHAQTMSHLEQRSAEHEIIKKFPSAFFATNLASLLTSLNCDTVLVAGCTTSGCVRATVLDALQYGFRPFVVEECVGDRSAEAHRVNLSDLQSKYAEVVSVATAMELIMSAHVKNRGVDHGHPILNAHVKESL